MVETFFRDDHEEDVEKLATAAFQEDGAEAQMQAVLMDIAISLRVIACSVRWEGVNVNNG